jgi:mono/diheme cytochrome c family protein
VTLLALFGACAPAGDGRARFEADVVPALERSCAASSCHGVLPTAEADGEVIDWATLLFRTDEAGRLTDLDAAYEAAKRTIVTNEDPAFSLLLRKPLAREYGGLDHHGGPVWASRDQPDYLAIEDWIGLESGGGQDEARLTGEELRFAEQVQPALAARGCMTGSCHGPDASVPFRLDPGLDGTFSRGQTRGNFAAVRRFLSLDGAPTQSRLLRKALPLGNGGIAHRGGNSSFFASADDDGAPQIQAMACRLREAELGAPCTMDDRGFIYVRGPVAPEDAFEADSFVPGSDLWWHHDGAEENLTAGLHDEPADIRDPAVDFTGSYVVFAMRAPADRGHRLLRLDLDSRVVTPLTGAGALGDAAEDGDFTDRDPTIGPDHHIWFVSSRAATAADDGREDTDIYELDPDSGALTRRTWTPHVERRPTFFVTGTEAGGEVGFTALREADMDQRVAHPLRFPPGLDTEYHQHFGVTPTENRVDMIREMADGRYAVVLGDLDSAWEGGRLAIVDRNMGPEIPDDSAPSLPAYLDPMTRLDDRSAASGLTGRLYRDPVGLPDGRLLVAVAQGPIDQEDPGASVRFRIVALTLAEEPDGAGPTIAARQLVVEDDRVSVYDPQPVGRVAPAPSTQTLWDPDATTGLFRHQGLPLIDAILANLPPAGERPVRDDLVTVRMLEPVVGGARILAELPIEEDGSFQAELPAGIPFRLQALDSEGREAGHPHNRWYYVAPGQILSQGTTNRAPQFYTARCAACHGAMSGDPEEVFQHVDGLTTASLSLSRYENQDPRRPIAPPLVDADGATSVDFRTEMRALLDARCVGCHAGADAAAGLDLDAEGGSSELAPDPACAALLDGYVEPGRARASYLVEKLAGEELEADRPLSGEAPHGGLSDEERLAINRWIDLGAPYQVAR